MVSKQQVLVFGEAVEKMPADLYIPPDALQILLASFEGPLDLLLYLIRKHKMDIFDVQISLVTQQYLSYIEMMKSIDITIAAEYLLMAATLADIKAKMLFPVLPSEDEQDVDPRAELIDRLLIYAQISKAADQLAHLPRVDEGFALSGHQPPRDSLPIIKPRSTIDALQSAMKRIHARRRLMKAHLVAQEEYSLSERMNIMKNKLHRDQWQSIDRFYSQTEGRAGLVIAVMAMLELDKIQAIVWQQQEAFGEIMMKSQ